MNATPLPPVVSEELMERTWKRVCVASRSEAQRLQQACGREQEELMGFVIGFSADLSPDAVGLVLYMHVVVAEAFRQSGAWFRDVKPGRIMQTWEAKKSVVESLRLSGRTGLEQHAAAMTEPAVFRYVVGAMTEEEQEDPVDLTDDEFWHMLRMMLTVVDCMCLARKTR